jgi:hypothetical protein
MVNVILSSDNVTVLGGPSILEVDLNIGATGTRGSLFFVGTQNPNSLNLNQDFPQVPAVFDIFINVNEASQDYLQAYQLTNQDGVDTWIPTFNINRNTYTVNKVVEFENGEATANLEIAQLGLDAVPFNTSLNSFAYFSINASLTNVDLDNLSATPLPSAMSFKIKDAIFDSNGSFDPGQFPALLPIKFNAVEFDGTGWNPISGKTTYVCITASFVNPNDIFQSLDFEVEE